MSNAERFWASFAVVVCLVGLYIGISAAGDSIFNGHNDHTTYYHAKQYMSAAGLPTSKPIPLQVGSIVTGTSGSTHGTVIGGGGFFLFFGAGAIKGGVSGNSQPSSSVRLGLNTRGNSYILEIPLSKIIFRISNSASSTAKFNLRNPIIGRASTTSHFNFMRLMKWEGPHVTPAPTFQMTKPYKSVMGTGLGAFIQQYIINIRMTVSAKQYASIIGQP